MAEEFLNLIYGHLTRVQQDRRNGMSKQMWIHSLLDACLTRSGLDDRLHRTDRITIVPIGFEKIAAPTAVQMRPQFLRESRQNRNVAVRLFLAVAEMDLRRVAGEGQVFDPDVNELIDPRPTEEQRLNHEPVLAVRLIGVLDQPLHFYLVQS